MTQYLIHVNGPEEKIEECIKKRLLDEGMPLAEITNMVMATNLTSNGIWLNVLLTVEYDEC